MRVTAEIDEPINEQFKRIAVSPLALTNSGQFTVIGAPVSDKVVSAAAIQALIDQDGII